MPSELKKKLYRVEGEKQKAFLTLLNPIYTELERFCFAMEWEREKALDLIGETLLRAYEHFEEIRDEKAFLAWLFTTASRLQRRWSWRRRIFGEYSEESAARLHSDMPAPDAGADLDALYKALALLSRKEREAIILFEINDLTLKEVLAIQGGSISALKVRLHRGRKRLAVLLGVEEVSTWGDPDESHTNNDRSLIAS